MADSAIESIYIALANLNLGGIKARNLPEVTLAVTQDDLPLRILVPNTKGDMTFIAIGDLGKIAWSIRDLCLFAPISGDSIEKYAARMVRYIKGYVAALKAMRAPTDQSYITEIAFALGPMPWGDNDYWAIDTALTVEEVL